MNVLITGGAGFIGSHLSDELLLHGHAVRVLDNLSPEVHGAHGRARPSYLKAEIELVEGDVRNRADLQRALAGMDAVVHLAARVGVGESMFRVSDYVEVNDLGTARLLECLLGAGVGRLIVASSMSIYGEGLYVDAQGVPVEASRRSIEQLRRGEWELRDMVGRPYWPVPTPESKPPELASLYALSKYVQERMCLLLGEAYDLPTTALRLFNVYGSRQELSNPYTGVLANFGVRLINDRPPLLFEDGEQRRDFVHVSDVARAFLLALETPDSAGMVLNIASGESQSVKDVALRLGRIAGKPDIEPQTTGRFRVGDIRNCFADIGAARRVLGYQPRIALDEGLEELVAWMADEAATDRIAEATAELERRGLVA